MNTKAINQSQIIKYVSVFLAVILLITSVVFGVKNSRTKQENEQLSSQLAEKESILEEKLSENEALSEKNSDIDKLYMSALELNEEQENVIKDLNEQLDKVKKELKKNNKKETTTKTDTDARLPTPVQAKDKTVYLTFDDGPCHLTPQVLDILDKYNVKATFFVVNGKYNSVMKDIVNRGHAIGLHCYNHTYSEVYASDEAYFKDLKKISDVVKKETGVEPNIIRFPGGSSNTVSKNYSKGIMTRLTKSVTEKGYAYFDWNCYNGDADGVTSVTKMVQNCSQYPKSAKNIVVLMHDNKQATVNALPKIIEYYKSCGMSFGVLTNDMPAVHHSVNN